MRESIVVAEFNIADLFELVADAVPDRVAVVSGDDTRTYAELDERSTRLAHALDLPVGRARRPVPAQLDPARRTDAGLLQGARRAGEHQLALHRRRDRLRRRRRRPRTALARRRHASRFVRAARRGRCADARLRSAFGRRPLRALHRRHDRSAEGRGVASRGHLLRRARRRESGRTADHDARGHRPLGVGQPGATTARVPAARTSPDHPSSCRSHSVRWCTPAVSGRRSARSSAAGSSCSTRIRASRWIECSR